MKRIRLTREERRIEAAIGRGEYVSVSKEEFQEMARAIQRRKKDAVLNIRINSEDLASIKKKAKDLGVPYQTLVSDILHQYAS